MTRIYLVWTTTFSMITSDYIFVTTYKCTLRPQRTGEAVVAVIPNQSFNIVVTIHFTVCHVRRHVHEVFNLTVPGTMVDICRRSILSAIAGARAVSRGPSALGAESSIRVSPCRPARWTRPSPIWRHAVARATVSWTPPSRTTSSTSPSTSTAATHRPSYTLWTRSTWRTCFAIY